MSRINLPNFLLRCILPTCVCMCIGQNKTKTKVSFFFSPFYIEDETRFPKPGLVFRVLRIVVFSNTKIHLHVDKEQHYNYLL